MRNYMAKFSAMPEPREFESVESFATSGFPRADVIRACVVV